MLEKKWIEYLKKQKDEKFEFKDIDKLQLAHLLITNIGDKDDYIRDGLIYPNLAHLLHDKYFSEKQLSDILETLISDDHLLFDMDNKEQFSVLNRSFTLLQLAIVVYVHRRDSIIDSELILRAYNRFKEYFLNEKVLIGYSDEVGWIHSIAHSADLFTQFMQIESFDKSMLEEMFLLITSKLKDQNHFYAYDEDERMVKAILKGLERKLLSKEFLIEWIHSFSTYVKITEYPEAYYLTNNIKCFLRSLYFALLDHEEYAWLVAQIKEDLKENVKFH